MMPPACRLAATLASEMTIIGSCLEMVTAQASALDDLEIDCLFMARGAAERAKRTTEQLMVELDPRRIDTRQGVQL